VALGAGQGCVLAGKRELGGAVIECGSGPILHAGVANRAVHREASGDVIGVGCALEVFHVARHAVCADVGVIAVRVALQARDRGVCSEKWELSQVVVEGGALPRCGLVTRGTIVRESRRHVIGVGGLGEVGEVATRAVGRYAQKAVPDVASIACQIHVRPS